MCTFRTVGYNETPSPQIHQNSPLRDENFAGKANSLRFCYIALYGKVVGEDDFYFLNQFV